MPIEQTLLRLIGAATDDVVWSPPLPSRRDENAYEVFGMRHHRRLEWCSPKTPI